MIPRREEAQTGTRNITLVTIAVKASPQTSANILGFYAVLQVLECMTYSKTVRSKSKLEDSVIYIRLDGPQVEAELI
jgi:phage host-nuclease inhibitor protein Gam